MADRVNTKFVFGLTAVLALITAGLIGVWYFLVYLPSGPERLVKQGDGFMAQGMIEDAIGQYGKAVYKRPDDLTILFKYVDALEQIKTDEPIAARKYIRQIGSALTQAVTQEPKNPVAYERVMSMYMRIGRELGDFEQWNKIFDMSDARIQAGMDTPLARKYRGIAQVFRMESLNLTPDQRAMALEDLTIAKEHFPEDRDPTYYLAAWHMMEARNLERTAAGSDQIRPHRDQALALIEQIIEARPDDPRLLMDRLRIVAMRETPGDPAIEVAIEQVLDNLMADPKDPKLVLEAAQMIPLMDRKMAPADDEHATATTQGLRRAEALLNSALAVHQDNPHLQFALGDVLRRQRRTEESMPLFRQVFETLALTDPYETLIMDRRKVQAQVRYADLLLDSANGTTDDEREKILAEVKYLIDGVAAVDGEDAQVNLVQGKLALLQKQWSLALTKLDQANAGFKDSNPEALLLSAQVRAKLGELGAATQQLERLTLLRPDFVPARYDLAGNYLRFGELAKAAQQVEKILEANPRDQRGLYFQARLLMQRGQLDEAIRILEGLDQNIIRDAPTQLARLYIAKGSPESAKQAVHDQFAANPKDTTALQMLVRLSNDAEEAKGYIDGARRAGVPEKALSLLDKQVEGDVDIEELIDKIGEESDTPLGLHLTRYRLFRQLGDQDKAVQELELARKIDPEHPVVISALFGIAINGSDWETAQSLADLAAAQNLDEAQGMFYYGRLELERGDADRAINTLRRGLKLRPVYSEGWRLLGDAQRESRDLEGATDSYQRSVTQRPNNTAALAGLARVHDVQGNRTEALLNLRKAVQFRPRDRALRSEYLDYEKNHGDPKQALALRQRAAQIDPQDISNQRALAMLLVELGQPDEGLAVVNRLIADDGNNRPNVATLANIYSAMGDADRANQVVKKYVYSLEDKAAAADWLLFARHLFATRKLDQCYAAYRQAITREDPKTRVATREFADLLFDQQLTDESLPYYKVLWESFPKERRVGLRYAEALVRSDGSDLAEQVLAVVNDQHEPDGTSLVLEAILLRAKDQTEPALELLNKAAELEPLNAMVYYRRGQLMATEPAMESAVITDLRRAADLDPNLTAARELLASLHLRRGERNEAVRELESVIKRKPSRTNARLRLAEIYREEGDTVLLRGLLEDSEGLFPKMPVWPQLRGHLEYGEGNLSEGIEKMKQAFLLAPSAQILGELIQMLIDADQTEGALEMLRQNSAAVSRVPYLQALRGQALATVGQQDAARAVFSGAVKQSDEFDNLAKVLGVMTDAIGHAQAIEIIEPTATGSQRGLMQLAMAQVEISDNQYQAANDRLTQIDLMIGQGTDLRAVYDRLVAVTLQQMDRPQDALAAYERVLDARPNDLITLNNTAYLLVDQLDRPGDAVRFAQRAATMAPNNPLVLDTLGWSLYKIGEVERSLQVLRRSVKLERTAPNCLHLAEVLLRRGDTSDAIDMFAKARTVAEEQSNQEILLAADKRLRELTQ